MHLILKGNIDSSFQNDIDELREQLISIKSKVGLICPLVFKNIFSHRYHVIIKVEKQYCVYFII